MQKRVCLSVVAAAVLAAAVVSCGKKDVESSAPSAVPTKSVPAAPGAAGAALAPGGSKDLKRNNEPPFYNFDYLGSIHYPLTQKAPQLSGDEEILVAGWAADPSKKLPAGGVDVVIDGTPFKSGYGTDRTDVASHYNAPAIAKSGFQLSIPKKQLTRGPHGMSIRVITAAKDSYNEGPTVQFTVN
jgi:hypothetical protein